MGTLSGGGTERVSIGERCLLGANSGIGIALGDDCVVEAGLYVTAGTKVTLTDGRVVKARELSGQPTCCSAATRSPAASRPRPRGHGIVLNAALHANDWRGGVVLAEEHHPSRTRRLVTRRRPGAARRRRRGRRGASAPEGWSPTSAAALPGHRARARASTSTPARRQTPPSSRRSP